MQPVEPLEPLAVESLEPGEPSESVESTEPLAIHYSDVFIYFKNYNKKYYN